MKIKRNRFFGNFLQEVPSLVPEKRPPKAEITTTLEAIFLMGEIWNVINRKWRANYDDVTLISLIAKFAKEKPSISSIKQILISRKHKQVKL